MQKFVLSTSLLFIISFAFTQDLSYEILEQNNNDLFDNILPAGNGYISFTRRVDSKPHMRGLTVDYKIRIGIDVNKLDKDLKLVSGESLFNGEKKLLEKEYDLFRFGKNICMLYQDVVDNKVGNVKLMTIDELSLKVMQDNTVIDFAKNNIDFDIKKLDRYSNLFTYHYMISSGKKMLMVYTEPEVDKDENKMFYITILNEDLKVIAQRKINLKEVSENVRAQSIIVDDIGNIYLAFKQYEDGESKGFIKTDGHKIGSYKNRLLTINAAGRQSFADAVKLDGLSVRGFGLIYSSQLNKTYILGSYSQGIDENYLGLFKAEIDVTNMKISEVVKTPFPDDLLSALDKDGYAKSNGKNKGIKNNYSCGYFLRGDGTADAFMQLLYRNEHLTDPQNNAVKSSIAFYEGSFIDAHFIDGKVFLQGSHGI